MKNRILVVDFDETLVKIDLFKDTLIHILLMRIYILPKIIYGCTNWVDFKLRTLNFSNNRPSFSEIVNNEVLDFIENVRDEFDKVILVSASPEVFLRKYIPNRLFNEIHGSKTINLKGKNKLKFIVEHFGDSFGYIGDSKQDQVIFTKSIFSVLVRDGKIEILKNDIF